MITKNKLRKNISRNLKQIRIARGYTQTLLAKKSKLSQPSMALMEQGARMPCLFSLMRIAHALDVPPSVIYDGEAK
jgi:transcriptional regulator with XRE-family HTH domain